VTDSLYEYAVRLLARRAFGTEELRRRLHRRGDHNEAEEVLVRLTRQGYLNDEEFADGRALICRTRKHWGNLRITQDLKRLGLNARMIRLAINRLDEARPEREGLKKVIASWVKAKGNPGTAADLKKLYDRCFRLGYRSDLVREELADFFDRINW
jgi:SOS response regulatory protein OraA/RecX